MLPEAGHYLAGRVGEQRCLVLLGLVERVREAARLVDGVCVGEEEMAAAGDLRCCPAGVVLTGESSTGAEVERGSVEDCNSVDALQRMMWRFRECCRLSRR